MKYSENEKRYLAAKGRLVKLRSLCAALKAEVDALAAQDDVREFTFARGEPLKGGYCQSECPFCEGIQRKRRGFTRCDHCRNSFYVLG